LPMVLIWMENVAHLRRSSNSGGPSIVGGSRPHHDPHGSLLLLGKSIDPPGHGIDVAAVGTELDDLSNTLAVWRNLWQTCSPLNYAAATTVTTTRIRRTIHFIEACFNLYIFVCARVLRKLMVRRSQPFRELYQLIGRPQFERHSNRLNARA